MRQWRHLYFIEGVDEEVKRIRVISLQDSLI